MKNKIWVILIVGFVLNWAYNVFALTTEELVSLKKSGISEDIIVFMAQNDYKDTDKVLKLKEVGYKDESIMAIIKSETKSEIKSEPVLASAAVQKPSEQKVDFQTSAKVKIFRYLMYRDKPLFQNKEAIEDAQVSISGKTFQINWAKKDFMDPLNAFQKEPFEPPLSLELSKGDVFGPGQEGYSYKLQTALDHNHKENLNMDGYWIIYLEPKDSKLIDYIKNTTNP